jgi:hypothetical protein
MRYILIENDGWTLIPMTDENVDYIIIEIPQEMLH